MIGNIEAFLDLLSDSRTGFPGQTDGIC